MIQDIRFQFMNSIRVAEKPINLNYIYFRNDNRTILDGTIVLDSANKVSVNHVLGSGNAKLKYTYLHGGVTTFEQSYDVAKETWDFAVSRKVYGDGMIKASYQTSKKLLGLDWTRTTKQNGSFKVLFFCLLLCFVVFFFLLVVIDCLSLRVVNFMLSS